MTFEPVKKSVAYTWVQRSLHAVLHSCRGKPRKQQLWFFPFQILVDKPLEDKDPDCDRHQTRKSLRRQDTRREGLPSTPYQQGPLGILHWRNTTSAQVQHDTVIHNVAMIQDAVEPL